MSPTHRNKPRRMAWWKLFLIAMFTLVAAGILVAVAGGILIAYDQ